MDQGGGYGGWEGFGAGGMYGYPMGVDDYGRAVPGKFSMLAIFLTIKDTN